MADHKKPCPSHGDPNCTKCTFVVTHTYSRGAENGFWAPESRVRSDV